MLKLMFLQVAGSDAVVVPVVEDRGGSNWFLSRGVVGRPGLACACVLLWLFCWLSAWTCSRAYREVEEERRAEDEGEQADEDLPRCGGAGAREVYAPLQGAEVRSAGGGGMGFQCADDLGLRVDGRD